MHCLNQINQILQFLTRRNCVCVVDGVLLAHCSEARLGRWSGACLPRVPRCSVHCAVDVTYCPVDMNSTFLTDRSVGFRSVLTGRRSDFQRCWNANHSAYCVELSSRSRYCLHGEKRAQLIFLQKSATKRKNKGRIEHSQQVCLRLKVFYLITLNFYSSFTSVAPVSSRDVKVSRRSHTCCSRSLKAIICFLD